LILQVQFFTNLLGKKNLHHRLIGNISLGGENFDCFQEELGKTVRDGLAGGPLVKE